MNDQIPEDILEKAEAVFEYWMRTADTVISELIARALLAEREAAEKRVREECASFAEGRFTDTYGAPVAKIIADGIREGSR
jgi:hypothetical protein